MRTRRCRQLYGRSPNEYLHSSARVVTVMPPEPAVRRVYVLELAGEDDAFAAREAGAAVPAGTPTVRATGVATAQELEPDRVQWLALTRHASEFLARTEVSVRAAEAALEGAPLAREGTVAVRARDVRSSAGIDTQAVERALGDILVQRGFTIDLEAPEHELRAVFATPGTAGNGSDDGDAAVTEDGLGVLGWQVASSRRDFGDRQPTERPFFQPGSMDPLLARAVVNLAGARPGQTICDPMCGTGGLLLEAGIVGADRIGTDVQRRMVRGTRENLRAGAPAECEDTASDRPTLALAQATAADLPLWDDAADAVVFDAPYGRQSAIAGRSAESLLSDVLRETARIAPRAVVVADRSLDPALEDAPWRLQWRHERRVHRSLVRHVHGLVR